MQIEHLQLHTGHGIGGAQIAHGHDHRSIVAAFCDQAEVGGEQVARDPLAMHVVGIGAGVLAFAVIVVLVVIAVVIVIPMIVHAIVGGLFLYPGKLVRDRCRRLIGAFARVGGMAPIEGQLHAVDRAGFGLEMIFEIEEIPVPTARIGIVGRSQRNGLTCDQTAHARQFPFAAELVHLQELRNISFMNSDHAHFHGAEVNGLEGKNEPIGSRQDHAFSDQAHCGFQVLEKQINGEVIAQRTAGGIAQRSRNESLLIAAEALLRIDHQPVAIDGDANIVRAGDADETGEILRWIERITEEQHGLLIVVAIGAGGDERQITDRRHIENDIALIGRSDPFGVPINVHAGGRFTASHTVHHEAMVTAVGLVFPDQWQSAIVLCCGEALFQFLAGGIIGGVDLHDQALPGEIVGGERLHFGHVHIHALLVRGDPEREFLESVGHFDHLAEMEGDGVGGALIEALIGLEGERCAIVPVGAACNLWIETEKLLQGDGRTVSPALIG